jgi:hypothetical protein
VLPPYVDLALEDEHHVVGRCAFFKQNVAGIGDDFLTVAGQPQAILERQVVQGAKV